MKPIHAVFALFLLLVLAGSFAGRFVPVDRRE